MKKFGSLIVALSLFSLPLFAQKPAPSLHEQTVGSGEKPCNCQKNTAGKVAREKAGTLAIGQGEKAEEATSTLGSGVGEQPVSKEKTTK